MFHKGTCHHRTGEKQALFLYYRTERGGFRRGTRLENLGRLMYNIAKELTSFAIFCILGDRFPNEAAGTEGDASG